MMSRVIAVLLLSIAATGTAAAGKLEHGAWVATGCGEEPVAPPLVTFNRDAYNDSLKSVKRFQTDIKTYTDCVFKEADDDGAAIHDAASSLQDRVNAAFKSYNEKSSAKSQKSDDNGSGVHFGSRQPDGGGNGPR